MAVPSRNNVVEPVMEHFVVNTINPIKELVSNAQLSMKAAAQDGPDLTRLQGVLDRFEVTIAEANELAVLEDYKIVVIADDSGSMALGATPAEQRVLGLPPPTRWGELKETLSLIIDMGSCFDASGLDIFFLNRPKLTNVRSSRDASFVNAFNNPPKGGTPLTECLKKVSVTCGGEKPVLLFILTDGEPNGGPARFRQALRELVTKVSTMHTFKVQIMACTSDDQAIGWLNSVDREFSQVDVTDDYYSERVEVQRAGRVLRFTRGDWCLKAMLGPISSKFDEMDERHVECAECTLQ